MRNEIFQYAILRLCAVLFLLQPLAEAAGPVVSNITAAQRAGTQWVDITYNVTAEVPTVTVILEISRDGGTTFNVPAITTSGAIGAGVATGTGKVIAWNAGADWDKQYSAQTRFKVTAADEPLDFALIPSGSFTMGDTLYEVTTHTVTVSAFYMAKNLVTWAEWQTVKTWAASNGYSDMAAGAGKASTHPVQTVSWWDGIKYCNARSQKEGLTPVYTVSGAVMKTGTTAPTANWAANGYRLPTEAEWEKAARGGLNGEDFPWGATISHSQANYFANSLYSYDLSGALNNYHPTYATEPTPFTSPVGSFAANSYGLNDMAGNVFQWCWDWWGDYNTASPTDPRGVSLGSYRVCRGGGWDSAAYLCRVAWRDQHSPYYNYYNTGFRVARGSVQVGSGFGITSDVTVNTRSSLATLLGLTLSSGTLSPAFASSTITYTASVLNTVTSIKITPTVTDATATVKVNGTTVASGTASGSIALAVGTNTITTVVTAEDGSTTETYTVTLDRALSAVATLSGLALSSGTLSPAFAAASTSYTASVTNATTSIKVTPTVTYTTATVKVNGTTVPSGTPSGSIALAVGTNTITTLVTALDGTSTRIYTVKVTRKSSDATLSALVVKTATLGPKFKAATTAYTASVPLATTSVKIMATANHNKATLKVNGKAVKSGALSTAIPLAKGRNTIKVVVTAEGGTTRTYTITISRKSSVGMAPMSVLADSHAAAETRVSKVAVNGQRFLQLSVVKPGPASRFFIEVSPNLVDWFSGDQHTTTVTDDGRILTVRDHTPLRVGEHRFIRVKRN